MNYGGRGRFADDLELRSDVVRDLAVLWSGPNEEWRLWRNRAVFVPSPLLGYGISVAFFGFTKLFEIKDLLFFVAGARISFLRFATGAAEVALALA